MSISITDVRAAMTYSTPIEESFTLEGVEIEIWRDQDAENPYHYRDGMAPALWYVYQINAYGSADLEDPIGRMTPGFVSRHFRKIESILGNADASEPALIKADYGGRMGEIRKEYYAECLADLRSESWGAICDYFETLAALWRLQGVPADTFQRNGYCQGDSARGLIVHLPGWVKRVGARHDSPESIERDMSIEADVYGSWAWGDVYGFTVGDELEDDTVESCGGFYGSDSDSLVSAIADSVNRVLNERAARVAVCLQENRPDLSPQYA